MQGYRHVTPITVRFRDLDAFGHVNNAVFFTYLESARVHYLLNLGLRSPEKSWQDTGVILAYIDCDFKRPIFFGQQVEVGTRVVQIRRSSLHIEHRIEADGEPAAHSKAVLVNYNYAAGRSEPVPAEMRVKIEKFEALTPDTTPGD